MKLQPHEIEAAKLMASGMDISEVCKLMNCGRKTVQGYLTRARKKTNSPTNRALFIFIKGGRNV